MVDVWILGFSDVISGKIIYFLIFVFGEMMECFCLGRRLLGVLS